ncbi:MAG: hypothetical protein NTY95_07020 [Bacteroidia bacterium]|nr:hypothetical protein [Bacteroidia bacterium]
MQNITSIAELKNAIQLSEVEQADKGQLLKEQFFLTYESFKPVNLIANTLNDIGKSPYLIENILGAAIGLVTGFYSNKLIFNARGNKLKKLIGVVLQFGVTNLVAKHQGTIRSIGQVIFKHLVSKKRMNSIKP